MQNLFWRTMARRTAALFIIILALMLICVVRIYVICNKALPVSNAQNSATLTACNLRGNIFDANMVSLTGNAHKILAAVTPLPQDVTALGQALSGQKLEAAREKLKQGKPILIELDKGQVGSFLNVAVPQHSSSENLAPHILGYIGSNGHGVSGIEAACDKLLYTDETLKLCFATDGHTNLLKGVQPTVFGDLSVLKNGVAITLDAKIQSATQAAMEGIEKGAAVVMEVQSGKIRAIVSKPYFDPSDVSKSLNDSDSPLINRALCAYNAGSIFKPCIAAAAIEQGVYSNMKYTCTGSDTVGGRVFNCNTQNGHGNIGLKEALCYSCNTFFYDLAVRTGADAIYNTALNFGFGRNITLADTIISAEGKLTSLATLKASNAAIANFAIGQGDLLLSPLSVCYMYCAIAGDGRVYYAPLVEGAVKNNKLQNPKPVASATRIMKESTAKVLREYLINAVQNGTGKAAQPKNCTAGGKTATAQTGWKDEQGKSVSQGWFCGFFPADNPKYVAVVLAENADSGGSACGPVFAQIADRIIS